LEAIQRAQKFDADEFHKELESNFISKEESLNQMMNYIWCHLFWPKVEPEVKRNSDRSETRTSIRLSTLSFSDARVLTWQGVDYCKDFTIEKFVQFISEKKLKSHFEVCLEGEMKGRVDSRSIVITWHPSKCVKS
jgi:hypothetical protein